MKGIVVASLGESRYTVKVKTSNALLDAEIVRLTEAYGASTDRLNELMISTAAAQSDYDVAMEQVYVQGRELQICLDDSVTFEDGLNAACNDTYGDCLTKCEEGENEKLLFCFEECETERDKCKLQIPDQLTKYLQDCHKNHAEAIAKAQSAAYEKMTALQNAKRIEELEKARRIEIAIKKETFESLSAREVIYTVFSAQYTDDLAPGAEVEIATTPDGHHAITSMIAQSNCLYDGRTLPEHVLFIDAALSPGAETWRPTWRVGTVLEVLQDTLKVRVTGGKMTGSLGTEESLRTIDCTPPQAYFDGNWADETAIHSAREALTAAQEALAAIYAARAACENSYDLNACRDPAWAACDVEWTQWLQECLAVNPPEDCHTAYEQSLNGCKEQALAACYVLRDEHIALCLQDHPSEQEEAEVLNAEAALRLALSNRYNPASPLDLEIPVNHCTTANYTVGDSVLIDFPTRSVDPNNPLVVWDSARIIGWNENTRTCFSYIDSGYLAIGVYNSNPSGGYIVERPVLYQNGSTLSLSDLLEATPPSAFSTLKPREPVDEETPPSFDYPEDTGTLWEKVSGVYYTATPSNWSGKLRLMGQARYGRVLSSGWNLGVPSNTGGSSDGYGLYTDTDHRYWLIHVEISANKLQITLTATLLDSPLYATVAPVLSDPGSTNEEKLIAEAYALAFASRSSTVITTTIDSDVALEGVPLAYQWHWLWNGSEARIVLHKDNWPTAENYKSSYYTLQADITDGVVTASVGRISYGTWAPNRGRAWVFYPSSSWDGSICQGYSYSGANTANCPLYVYVKTYGSVLNDDQEFVSVTSSFDVSYSSKTTWLSSCTTISAFEDAFNSDTHGRIIVSEGSSYAINGADGSNRNENRYVFTRYNKLLSRVISFNPTGSGPLYDNNTLSCGGRTTIGSYSGATSAKSYRNTCTHLVETGTWIVNQSPVLVIPAGDPDSCIIGLAWSERRQTAGFEITKHYREYEDRIEYTLRNGGTAVSKYKHISLYIDSEAQDIPDTYYHYDYATYNTSLAGHSISDGGNMFDSFTSPISLSNTYTTSIAMVVSGVTNAYRGGGVGETRFNGGFPIDVGTGKSAVIGFG